MEELTRQQEAKIAELAIHHASVSVEPLEDGTVIARGDHKAEIRIDQNGRVSTPDPESAMFRLPVAMLRTMLGDTIMDAALNEVRGKAYSDHALGRLLDAEIHAWCIARVMEEAKA